jgi:hypothetical protein
MVPRIIGKQLHRLREREQLLRFTCGAARWLALVVTLLLLAGLTDWLLDRAEESPWAIRVALLVFQVFAATAALIAFVLVPPFRRLSNSTLALWVEDKNPPLQHRLISAVQLNRRGADTEGMSPELIAKVTGEAETEAAAIDFIGVADHRRFRRSAAVATLALIAAVLPFLLWPAVASVLLARQFLGNAEIPRSVYLENVSDDVWPSGEKVTLRFLAHGDGVDPVLVGEVQVEPEGGPRDRYPLAFEKIAQGGAAHFTTTVPPLTTNFRYRARLADGRTRKPGLARFEPRPVVVEQHAAVVLPEFCGVKPSGGRYEQPQPRGDVVAIPGSAVRVAVKIQKPVTLALARILGVETDGTRPAPAIRETVIRSVAMMPNDDGTEADVLFDLLPGETAYQIVLEDKYGFDNRPPPRRVIRIVPEEPPQVYLLREVFPPGDRFVSAGLAEDFEVEGMPVPPGGSIRIGYSCTGAYGLGQARLLFRVLKKLESGEAEAKEEPWHVLPLPELTGTPLTGAFDPRRGVFENSGPRDQVPFHAVPSPDPEKILGRTLGGGRFDFKTTGIPDGKGGYRDLRPGDQIEFCVEVFADKNVDAGRPFARSETRVKTIVSLPEFARWIDDTLQEESRIRKLDAQQRGVFP